MKSCRQPSNYIFIALWAVHSPAVRTVISASTIDLFESIGGYADTKSWQVASTVKVTIIYLRKPLSRLPLSDQSSYLLCFNPAFELNPLGTSANVSLLSWARVQPNPRYRIVPAEPLNSTTIGDINKISREHYRSYMVIPLTSLRPVEAPIEYRRYLHFYHPGLLMQVALVGVGCSSYQLADCCLSY